MRICVNLTLLSTVIAALAADDESSSRPADSSETANDDVEWTKYKRQTNQRFVSSRLETARRAVWSANSDLIRGHNLKADKGDFPFRLAPNHFMDKTDFEYRLLLGARISVEARESAVSRQVGAPFMTFTAINITSFIYTQSPSTTGGTTKEPSHQNGGKTTEGPVESTTREALMESALPDSPVTPRLPSRPNLPVDPGTSPEPTDTVIPESGEAVDCLEEISSSSSVVTGDPFMIINDSLTEQPTSSVKPTLPIVPATPQTLPVTTTKAATNFIWFYPIPIFPTNFEIFTTESASTKTRITSTTVPSTSENPFITELTRVPTQVTEFAPSATPSSVSTETTSAFPVDPSVHPPAEYSTEKFVTEATSAAFPVNPFLTPTTEHSTTSRSTTTSLITSAGTTKKSGVAVVDYRSDPCMPAMKDQGTCGSCWAFTATLCTEYLTCKKQGNPTVLSEQQLVDCDAANKACNGGFYDTAWDYIKSKGQCGSSSYPYTSGASGTFETCKETRCTTSTKVLSHRFIPNNADQIVDALTKIGPVAVALNGGLNSFRYYSSGIYDDVGCKGGADYINHAVNIVGYGTSKDGVPYWIIRNHWSSLWGMNGYGYMKRGVNMCGIEDWAAYPTV